MRSAQFYLAVTTNMELHTQLLGQILDEVSGVGWDEQVSVELEWGVLLTGIVCGSELDEGCGGEGYSVHGEVVGCGAFMGF